jgi:hypothetical protein
MPYGKPVDPAESPADSDLQLAQRLARRGGAVGHAAFAACPHWPTRYRTLGRQERAKPEQLPEDLEHEIDWRSRREPQVPEPGLLGQAAQPLFSCLCAEAQADLLG